MRQQFVNSAVLLVIVIGPLDMRGSGAPMWPGLQGSTLAAVQKPAPGPAAPGPAVPIPTAPERFTVQSDGHPIAVWARRPSAPKGTILLIHGRTWSARPDFDLQVPGLQRSVMMSLATHGFAAYAVDLRGYGETPRDATGWLTPKRATTDVVNVLSWIQRQHPTLPPPAVLGWSRGGAIAMMAAQAHPTRVSAFITFGFVFDPDLQFVDVTHSEKPMMDKNTAESAASDFITPKITPPAVIKAFVEQALKADPVLADLRGDAEYNVMRPARLTTPTLVLYGDNDPGVPHEDAGKFFARVAAGDKQMIVLPEGDHAAHIEDTHDAWITAVVNFLTRPRLGR
jgi:pimeloyl-ACP methyl ester carboxylesterase